MVGATCRQQENTMCIYCWGITSIEEKDNTIILNGLINIFNPKVTLIK